jgi:hypothetical protein
MLSRDSRVALSRCDPVFLLGKESVNEKGILEIVFFWFNSDFWL